MFKSSKSLLVVIVTVAMISLAFSNPATASEGNTTAKIDAQVELNKDGIFPRSVVFLNVPSQRFDDWGFTCSGVASYASGYYETHCGASYKPMDNMSLTLGVGMESRASEFYYRSSASIFWTSHGFAAFGLLETGSFGLVDGLFHVAKLTYTTGPVTFGIMSQRYSGEGLVISAGTKKLQFYMASLFNTETFSKDNTPADDCLAVIGGIVFTPTS